MSFSICAQLVLEKQMDHIASILRAPGAGISNATIQLMRVECITLRDGLFKVGLTRSTGGCCVFSMLSGWFFCIVACGSVGERADEHPEIARSCDQTIRFSDISRTRSGRLGAGTSPMEVTCFTCLIGDGSLYDKIIPKW